jgi:16S rRNA A1518/A1519 N6-dimethyltransferase RsmA/KsgA/DIM1 with predicted DNA glycosylase/AP lyase activity
VSDTKSERRRDQCLLHCEGPQRGARRLSWLVLLAPLAAPPPCDRKLLETVTQAAFGQRRKMLRQSLRSLGTDVTDLLSAADLSPMARAEDIPIDGFVSLARALAVQHALRHDAGA